MPVATDEFVEFIAFKRCAVRLYAKYCTDAGRNKLTPAIRKQ